MFGMLFLVASVVLLSLSHLGENDNEVTTQNLMPAYIPALMSVLAGFLFGIRMVFIKYAVQVQHYDGVAFAVGHPAIDAFLCSIAATILLGVSQKEDDKDYELILKAFAAGFLNGIGLTAVNYCVTVGQAGPAGAILSTFETGIPTIMDILILDQATNGRQLIALFLAIFGVSLTAVGDRIQKQFCGAKSSQNSVPDGRRYAGGADIYGKAETQKDTPVSKN